MTVNRDQKSQLAKLMATENITVQHQAAETASFDVKKRVLTLPIFKEEMSNDVYDLMVSHEVAHALWTPLEGWHDAVCDNGPMYKGFLNIIEDARIERKIKQKFPGLLASYRKGYKELLDKDFFGLANQDLEDMAFIDRINVFFKTGTLTGLRFEGDELPWIERIAKAETFEDVKKIADELFASEKQKAEEKAQEMEENGEFDEPEWDEDFDGEDAGDFSDWDDQDDEETEETETSGSGSASGETEEADDQETTGSGNAEVESQEKQENTPKPEKSSSEKAKQDAIEEMLGGQTEKNLHKNQSMLNKMNAREIEYHYMPASVKNYGDFIVGYKDVIKEFYQTWKEHPTTLREAEEKALAFRKGNIKIINTMVKEFEMRKKADEFKRTSIAKTGELDMNKIFGYKFNDDLFLRNAVVRDGKNHGFVMYIDWSGSMASQMSGTIDQLMNLVMFCKKVRIPFEVFAFTDGWVKRSYDNERVTVNVDQYEMGDLVPENFALVQLVSSAMSTSDYNKMLTNLMSVRMSLENGRYYRSQIPSKMQLGSTPLNDALTITSDLIRDFKAKYRVQVVNFVVLTDGESHACGRIQPHYEDASVKRVDSFYQSYRTDGVLVDRVTKKQYKIDDRGSCTEAMLKSIKDKTGCNTIGIFLVDNKPREIRSVFGRYGIWNADIKEFRAKKFFALKNAGYDTYFLMPGGDLALDDDEFEVDKNATKARIRTAFLKHNKAKTDNRVFIGKLMEIAA